MNPADQSPNSDVGPNPPADSATRKSDFFSGHPSGAGGSSRLLQLDQLHTLAAARFELPQFVLPGTLVERRRGASLPGVRMMRLASWA
jgi:hypothetical protein